MTVIKDGTGTGFLARVNEENRLSVVAVSVTEIANESIEDGTAFEVFGTTTITAATEKTVLVVINNSDTLLRVHSIITSVQNEATKITTIKKYIGTKTFTSGGTTVTPVNLNTMSLNLLDVTAVANNPTLGGTDSQIEEIYSLLDDTIIREDIDETVLAKTKSIRITCTGAAGATGGFNCAVSMTLFTSTEILPE